MSALVVNLSSSKWGFGGSLLSLFAVLPMLVVYIAFLPKDGPAPRQLPPLVEKHDRIATDLCWRVVVLLTLAKGIQVLIFGLGKIYCIQALLVGVAKALSWFFLLRTVRSHIPQAHSKC